MITVTHTVEGGEPFDHKRFESRLLPRMDAIIDRCEKDYQSCVKTWSTPVRWTKQKAKRMGEDYRAAISTGNIKFIRVTRGTGPRAIVSTKRPMRFRIGYHPKTTPNSIGSGRSKRFGGWRSTWRVKHHRAAPRRFTEAIAWRRAPELRTAVVEALV